MLKLYGGCTIASPTNIPEISQAATAYLTHNRANRTLGVRNSTVTDNTLTAPPVSPGVTDVYIPLAPATGAWAGQETKLARFEDGAWQFYDPFEGQLIYSTVDVSFIQWNGVTWNPVSLGSGLANLSIQDEGIQQTATPSSINFTGTAVTVTAVGNDVTVDVSGTGGGGFTLLSSALMVVDLALVASTVTTLPFSNVLVTDGNYNNANYRYTAPADGWYFVSAGVRTLDAGSIAGTRIDAFIYLNGVDVVGWTSEIIPSAGVGAHLPFSYPIELTTGDTIEITVFATNAISIDDYNPGTYFRVFSI